MEDTWVHRRVLLFEVMHFLRAATPASKASTPVRQEYGIREPRCRCSHRTSRTNSSSR